MTLGLFGSVARDEAGLDSDVDVLVGTKRRFSLFDFVGVNRHLEAALGRPVLRVQLFVTKLPESHVIRGF